MISIIKFIFFILCCFTFGFISLSQLTKIKSLHLLIPFSISFGISSYIFACHILSFLIGPQSASVLSIILLFLITIIILICKRKNFDLSQLEISKYQLVSICLIALIICTLSFLAVFRFGTYDKEFHFQLASTLIHNNVYPPRDFYKPEYILLYHFGGDLLASTINYISNISIPRCYELISTIVSGTTFLSFFALAWILTKSFRLSLIAGFCTYFGGGLLWLDAILRFFLQKLPQSTYEWNFLQTFFSIGIHGGIINAPSVLTFSSTAGIGNPLLIFSLILLWKMFEEKDLKSKITYIIFLNISLFSLFLTAEWLYMTFWAGVLPFMFILFLKKQKQSLILTIILLTTSTLLAKTFGNALFLQDEIQKIGRAIIFNLGIKEKLFSITSWGRLSDITMNYQEVSCFSWNFISEFGLSLFLLPFAIIYLAKTKNMFAFLLALIAITTMPLPVLIDFKLNPVDANRLFCFGNNLIVLLISVGIFSLHNTITKSKILISGYLFAFCLSPLSGLISASVFTPYISTSKTYIQEVFERAKQVNSLDRLKTYFSELNAIVTGLKNKTTDKYKDEIKFLKETSMSGDVAISSAVDIPAYGGVYSLIPSNKWLYKDLLYSSYDSIYLTTLTTLDPYLLNELNIKWVLISNESKLNLSLETQNLLNKTELFKLTYTSKQNYQIYHVEDINKFLKINPRKTAWLLVNSLGQPIEVIALQLNKITLFPSSKDALLYLKSIYNVKPDLKKILVTSQAISIESLENQLKASNLNISLDRRQLF